MVRDTELAKVVQNPGETTTLYSIRLMTKARELGFERDDKSICTYYIRGLINPMLSRL